MAAGTLFPTPAVYPVGSAVGTCVPISVNTQPWLRWPPGAFAGNLRWHLPDAWMALYWSDSQFWKPRQVSAGRNCPVVSDGKIFPGGLSVVAEVTLVQ